MGHILITPPQTAQQSCAPPPDEVVQEEIPKMREWGGMIILHPVS